MLPAEIFLYPACMLIIKKIYFKNGYFPVICFIFPRKQSLTLQANCLNRRQFAWNVKACFLEKIRKNIWKCHLLKFLPSMLSIKENILQCFLFFSLSFALPDMCTGLRRCHIISSVFVRHARQHLPNFLQELHFDVSKSLQQSQVFYAYYLSLC